MKMPNYRIHFYELYVPLRAQRGEAKQSLTGDCFAAKNFLRNDVIILICLGFIFLAADASACSVCFKGDPGQTANIAARAGVLMMLGVVAAVLGLFAYFFLSLVKKSTTLTGKVK